MDPAALRVRLGGSLRPLRDRPFRGMFAGAVCSGATDGIVPVAFAVYSVQAFGSAASLTIILIALWAGRFACTPLAGIAAGRRDQFTVMILSDAARIAAQGGLALFSVVAGRDSLLAMSVSAGIYGAATAFYGPAVQTALPRVVPAPDLRTANALVAMVADLSVLAGPALAVVLLETTGFVWILVFDSVTFAMNLLALMYARRSAGDRPADADSPAGGEPFRRAGNGGAVRATLAEMPWLGWSVGLWFAVSVAIGVVAVAGPALTVARTGEGGYWAALATGMALAGLAGSVSVAAGQPRAGWRFTSFSLGVAVAVELVAIAGYARGSAGYAVLFAGCLIAGWAVSVAGIIWQSLVQVALPTRALGGFSSVEGFVNAAGVPAGMIIGGLALAAGGFGFAAVAIALAILVLAGIVRVVTRPAEGRPEVVGGAVRAGRDPAHQR